MGSSSRGGCCELATTNSNREIKYCSKDIIDHSKKWVYPLSEQILKIVLKAKINWEGSPLFSIE